MKTIIQKIFDPENENDINPIPSSDNFIARSTTDMSEDIDTKV